LERSKDRPDCTAPIANSVEEVEITERYGTKSFARMESRKKSRGSRGVSRPQGRNARKEGGRQPRARIEVVDQHHLVWDYCYREQDLASDYFLECKLLMGSAWSLALVLR